jgi:hypothetical protein
MPSGIFVRVSGLLAETKGGQWRGRTRTTYAAAEASARSSGVSPEINIMWLALHVELAVLHSTMWTRGRGGLCMQQL